MSESLRPPVVQTVSEFADQHRYISDEFSAEPGPWRTARVPYMRQIMDSFADPGVDTITLVKSSRLAGTETMNNCLLYGICSSDPGPVMFVLPTEDDAKDEANGRLRLLIESCEAARRFIPRSKGGSTFQAGWVNGERLRLIGPRTIYMAWAQAPRTLIRKTCMTVYFDEVDNCERAAGSLGNSLSLAEQRVATYGRRGHVVSSSTPSLEHAAAWQAWLASDRRRYHVPCPHCGVYQHLQFDRVLIDPEIRDAEMSRTELANRIETESLAYYKCIGCSQHIEQSNRDWMVARGVWVPESQRIEAVLPLDDADKVQAAASMKSGERWSPPILGAKPATRRIGFHVWSAYSPWRTWSQILAEWFRSKDDPEKLRVFVNQWLGEPWRESSENLPIDALRAKRGGAPPRRIVPDDALAVLCYADVQRTHIYYVFRAFGPNQCSWMIHEGTVLDFEALWIVTNQEFTKQSGGIMCASYLGIDSGDGSRTYEVYDFARKYPGILPTKGMAIASYPWRPSRIDYTPDGKIQKSSLTVFMINTDHYKVWVHRTAAIPRGELGYWGVHRDTPEEYFQQVTSEHRVWVQNKNGRAVPAWRLKTAGRANHYLDCEVGMMMLADMKGYLALKQPDETPPPKKKKVRALKVWGVRPDALTSG